MDIELIFENSRDKYFSKSIEKLSKKFQFFFFNTYDIQLPLLPTDDFWDKPAAT